MFSRVDANVSLPILNGSSSTTDVFIIGNIYKYLNKNLETRKTLSATTVYYFQLLENQYLSNKLRLK
jgi:hypothetical protein